MASRVRYLIQRSGRYHARIVVPERLRSIIGKTELSAPLGADRRTALRRLPAAVAGFHDQIASAEGRLAGKPASIYHRPLTTRDFASIHHSEEMGIDDVDRLAGQPAMGDRFLPGWIDALRKVASGRADNEETAAVIGWAIDRFAERGRPVPKHGTEEWRRLARDLAGVQLDTLDRQAERDRGDFSGAPKHPLLVEPTPEATAPVTVREIFDGYRVELQASGKARNSERRWKPAINALTTFLKHDDASRITRLDIIRWKDHLLEEFAPKTVRDFYLATARAAFNWAVDNSLLTANPFLRVKVRLAARPTGRERGYNDDEATAILKAALAYQPQSRREHRTMVAAKRWAPLLAAYTGARIVELMQLRKEDVRQQGGIDFIRLTPDAGSIKSGQYRDVPLHPHLVELGFVEFVGASAEGPLFYRQGDRAGKTHPAAIVGTRVAGWVRSLDTADASVQPNHGWRHRFKTVGRETGIDGYTLDAIQGHAPRTASDNYGDVTLKTKYAAVSKLPRYKVGR